MTREEFIKKSMIMGLGVTLLPSLISSCKKESQSYGALSYDGDVLIIGAGAAGMMAAYRLAQNNISFTVLEASSTFGGRVKKAENFADFPIDIGAEWIHTDPSVFGDLINDSSVKGSVDLIPFNPETVKTWHNNRLNNLSLFNDFYGEYKFKSSTWFDFFEDYIVPSIQSRITYNSPVAEIDYSGNRVQVTVDGGAVYEADRVIVTVPVTILQQGLIAFTPEVPQEKLDALNSFDMPDGIKVFIEFSERFYPDILMMNSIFNSAARDRIYYDAAFKKNSSRHILGLFTVGSESTRYASLENDQEVIDLVLSELDEIFDNKATRHYIKHIVQNWTKEPYIRGSYNVEEVSDAVDVMQIPLDGKVFFAGEAFTNGDSATVHGAGFSGFDMVGRAVSS